MVSLRGSALGAAARQPLLALFLVGLAVFSFSGHAMVPKTVQVCNDNLCLGDMGHLLVDPRVKWSRGQSTRPAWRYA